LSFSHRVSLALSKEKRKNLKEQNLNGRSGCIQTRKDLSNAAIKKAIEKLGTVLV